MRVLVTGGAGFIGSHISESLVKAGHEVVIYDNFSSGLEENIETFRKDVSVIRADILDREKLLSAMKGIDFVSHQAAQLEIFKSTDDPYFDLEANTIGSLNVLESARKHKVKRVVQATSACIYGQVDSITPENCNPLPNWAYGISKLAADRYGEFYKSAHGLSVVNLRYAIVYGEREWYRRVLPLFIKRVIQDQSPVVFDRGDQVRDFIHVSDVVSFHNVFLDLDKNYDCSFNVGSGVPTTIAQLAQSVVDVSGKNLKVLFEEIKEGAFSELVEGKRRNASELKMMWLDVSKARKELNWVPQVTLKEGLQRTLDWASRNLHRWESIKYSS